MSKTKLDFLELAIRQLLLRQKRSMVLSDSLELALELMGDFGNGLPH